MLDHCASERTETAALHYCLNALTGQDGLLTVATSPFPIMFLPDQDLVVAVTASKGAELHRVKDAAVMALPRPPADHILIRVGETCGELVDVQVDVALCAAPYPDWSRESMYFWSDHRSLWLVPEDFGPAIALRGDGAALDARSPYRTRVDRALGVARAARAIASLAETPHEFWP
ncbi:hypothetical protein AB3M93_20035 [Novosphingobium panipatense]|jgi:hypothetical protein|uniref:hypothetical protein n=1 Tax=Novosphingobium TaxID=165696 RepID=UPI0028ABC5A2|nr:hypothetical protein [Novosphingobium sp.]